MIEKHIKQISKLFNRQDDRSAAADVEVVFSWQSGHRPWQRGTTYGIDGAFPDTLQPALLRVYRWASQEWHVFLRISTARCQRVLTMSRTSQCTKRQSTPPLQDRDGKRRKVRTLLPTRNAGLSSSTTTGPNEDVWIDLAHSGPYHTSNRAFNDREHNQD